MFVPKHFTFEGRDALLAFIEAYSFGVLITHGDSGYEASHLPVVVDVQQNCLYLHLARANSQVEALAACDTALMVFSGEHAYLSPRWYVSSNNVPTWNYSAVHATVKVTLLDQVGTIGVVDALSAFNESGFDEPWSSENMDQRKLDTLYKGIVGFKLDIETLQGKRKLSQNKKREDRLSVIQGLQAMSFGEGVARDMLALEEVHMDDVENVTALRLECLKEQFVIHRLSVDARIPDAVLQSRYYWVGKSDEELSIVCNSDIAVSSSKRSEAWSCFKVCGPLNLGMTGVLAGLTAILRDADISIFALSTYDTDYILVKTDVFLAAQIALKAAGYTL